MEYAGLLRDYRVMKLYELLKKTDTDSIYSVSQKTSPTFLAATLESIDRFS